MMHLSRRGFLGGLAATVLGAPLLGFSRPARADGPVAQRVIFFYFPDGVPGQSQNGETSLWHCLGNGDALAGDAFSLPSVLSPLAPHQGDCVFLEGLSLGPTDTGSHPGGAKKLLTGVDGGGGWSIDHYLAQTVGQSAPHRHLYLGAMANQNGASGDKHLTYVAPGQTIAPQDDPRLAFAQLFGAGGGASGAAPGTTTGGTDPKQVRMIDAVLAEVHALRTELGSVEATKLDLHLSALSELEHRIKMPLPAVEPGGACPPGAPSLNDADLYDPARFPDVLRAQMDLMVAAMACGLTKVGTIQCSHHTSELILSRFPGTEMYVPNYDMRSHQASHYGPAHDEQKAEFDHFVKQRRWFVAQFAYLLEQLKARPEGDGTMLDHSLLVLCSEVSDGNTHSHDDVPFILAGRAGGGLNTGRCLRYGYQRHSDLLVSIARALGQDIWTYGQASNGPLPSL